MAAHAPANEPELDELPDGVEDFDALIAEAQEERYSFRLGGHVFYLTSLKDLDMEEVEDVIQEIEDEVGNGALSGPNANLKFYRAQIRLGLGDDREYAKFEAVPESRTLRILSGIMAGWEKKSGIKKDGTLEGKGRATARRSKASSGRSRKR